MQGRGGGICKLDLVLRAKPRRNGQRDSRQSEGMQEPGKEQMHKQETGSPSPQPPPTALNSTLTANFSVCMESSFPCSSSRM